MNEKNPPETKSPFSVEMDDFTKKLDSIADSYPLIMELLAGKMLFDARAFENLVRDEGVVEVGEGTDERTFSITPDTFKRFTEINTRMHNSEIAMVEVPRQSVVSCVSQYDAYLSRLIRVILLSRPEVLNSSEREIKFSELLTFSSIEEARDMLLEKEVESVMRRSHVEQFEWLEGKLRMKLREDLPSFTDFVEITERRNLFVHCNGTVSRQYQAVCRQHGVSGHEARGIGEQLEVDAAYFRKCHNVLFEIGVKLGHVIWRKLHPDQLDEADKHLISVCYNLIVARRYRLAINLLQFATETLKKHHDQEALLIFKVNKALAFYLAKRKDECNKVIGETDWSACSDKFKLAVAVLQERYEDAGAIMRVVGPKHADLNKFSYRLWPLFEAFRESDQFKTAFQEIYGEDFVYVESRKSSFEDIIAALKHARDEAAAAKQQESQVLPKIEAPVAQA